MTPASQIPVPALPSPQLAEVGTGLSRLLPLSRKGVGPGMIILVPDTDKSLAIENGVPSPLIKWGEEGYTVIQVQASALAAYDAKSLLEKAIQALTECDKCEPKRSIGLVAYNPALWDALAPSLDSFKDVMASVAVYATAADASMLQSCSIPTIQHLAGKAAEKPTRTEQSTVFDYPGVSDFAFATPFTPAFDYRLEGLSHTRTLTFFKPKMGGPYFDLEAIWEEHTYWEFENRSVEHTMSTMAQEPYVNHIPTLTGGVGRDKLTSFYRNHFIFSNPDDAELELVSRTIGIDRVVDEFIYKITHDREIDWLLPGIPPTGRKLEIPFMAVVNIRGDRLYHEHITWDQATALVQLGLMPEYLPFPYPLADGRTAAPNKKLEVRVPADGMDTAAKLRDRNAVESNAMLKFKVREVSSRSMS